MDTAAGIGRGTSAGAWSRAAAVGVGGAIGALARWGLDMALAVEGWPAATMVANLLGAFVLALVSRRLGDSAPAAGLRVGVLGAFTTWSALVVQVVDLGDRPVVAVAYLVTSLAGGLALAALGLQLDRPVPDTPVTDTPPAGP